MGDAGRPEHGRGKGGRNGGELLRAYWLLLGLSLRAGRGLTGAYLAGGAVHEAALLASIYGGKLLVDAALAGSGAGVLRAALLWAGAYGVAEGCMRALVAVSASLIERVGLALDDRLMALLGGLPGTEHHERPEYLDEVALLRAQRGVLVMGLPSATALAVGHGTALLGSAALLARLDPLLLLLPLSGLGAVWAGRRVHAVQQRAEQANAEPGRLRRHLFATATAAPASKELRVFGLTETLVARHRAVAERMAGETVRAAWQRAGLQTLAALLAAGGTAAAVALVLVRATTGAATAGDVALVVGLAAQLSGAVQGVVGAGDTLRGSLAAAARYQRLEDAAALTTPRRTSPRAPGVAGDPAPAPVPARLAEGITVDGVSFRYPGTDRPVLENVSLSLPAGAVVALVGENGAGKSTLVKLLCRFYEPDGGRILADRVDLQRFDVREWRTRLSAGYQDFCRFELLAREAVGVGDLPRLADPPAIGRALTRAGAARLPAGLPRGLETQLGPSWEGGVDLSGGQWQQLALARALMRPAPLLLVLDEPTASLDAQTEHALFERLAAAARAGLRRGTVTLLVSHRFSTVRMADTIVVLDGGRVREMGSHEALTAAGGLYAELYGLQARAYR